ncbi:hypothetical protein [Halosimplex salinum]|uniref:hypothetical protein n=1 Tax=Halosimplex salinum TaxID=1710538 RepID=UPI000F49A2FA|nr:hypothetical protein [Halosimplex salinum]
MQFLSHPLGVGVALALAVGVSALVATQSVARPLGEPAFRPNETDHHHDSDRELWSRDSDTVDRATLRNWTGEDATERSLAATTDVPFNRPVGDVAEWNLEVVSRFPQFRADRSVFPASASLVQGTYVRDAYVEIFTVQPSTIVRAEPDRQPRYVAPEGELFATLDYRLAVPEDSDGPYYTLSWELQEHNVTDLQLLVDGRPEVESDATRTPHLEYDLENHFGTDHTLRVTANVTVTIKRHNEWCSNLTAGNCTSWSSETTNLTETISVSDSIDVKEHSVGVSGYYARFPDGDLGVMTYLEGPWLGYELPGGRINGVWRFYSARDPGWDSLITSTESGTSRRHSPMHPLRLSAYPIKTGPTASPADTVSIQEVLGREHEPPSLPGTVILDVLEQSYTGSFRIAARYQTPDQDVSDLTVYGLVRGVKTEAGPDTHNEVSIYRSNLTLKVLDTTAETATVQVTLREAQTGDPISTGLREGYVVLAGERVQTDTNGTFTTTIDRPPGAITARFEPKRWWQFPTAYAGDSDTVSVDGTAMTIVRWIYRAGVPVALFLLAVFLIDRITGMPVWPPWRGL